MDNPDLEIISKPDFDSSNVNGVGYGDGNGNGFARGDGDGNGNHYGTGSGNGDGDGFVHGYSNGYDYGYGDGDGDGFSHGSGSGSISGGGDGGGDGCFLSTGRNNFKTSRVFVSPETPIIAWWRIGEREHFGKPLPMEPGSVHEWPYEPVLCEHGLHACWRKEDTSNYSDGPLYKVACSGWVRTDGEKLVCTRRVVLGKIINPLG